MNLSAKPFAAARFHLVLALFQNVKDTAELEQLLAAILTPSELDALTERALIVKALLEGKPQREISRITGSGLATIARGSRELKYGSGILQTLFQRIT